MHTIFTTINTPHDPIINEGVIRNKFDNTIPKEIYDDNTQTYSKLYKEF